MSIVNQGKYDRVFCCECEWKGKIPVNRITCPNCKSKIGIQLDYDYHCIKCSLLMDIDCKCIDNFSREPRQ
jgi:hypothetical protein